MPINAPYPMFYGDVEPGFGQQNLFAGVPGMNNPMGAIFGPMLLQQFLPNTLPLQFSPTQNYYDHIRAMQFNQQRFHAMRTAADADMRQLTNMQRGMARMFGTDWTPALEARAETFSSDLTRMAPYFSMFMPEAWDAIHGSRGSAITMADQVFRAGRFMFDPASGRIGMTGAEAGRFTAGLHSELYSTDASTAEMRGFGAGRAGVLLREMVGRGLMSSPRSYEEAARMMTQGQGFGASVTGIASELEPIATSIEDMVNNPQFQKMVRTSNIQQTSQQLRDMARAVAAMQDLFGSIGKPNAPIAELMNNIQALTRDGMTNLRPAELERIVREFQATSQISNVRYDQLMGFNQGVSQLIQQAGLNPVLAPYITQHAATFSAAHGQQTGSFPMFGRMSRDQAAAIDARLMTNAATSPASNAANAIMMLGQGLKTIDPSSELFQVFEAIRSGRTEYEFGGQRQGVLGALSFDRLMQLAGPAGVDRQALQSMLQSPEGTQEFGPQTMGLVRRIQLQADILPHLAGVVQADLSTLSQDPAELGRMSIAFADALMSMDQGAFANIRTRGEEIGRRMFGDRWSTMSAQERGQALQTIQAAYGSSERFARDGGYGSMVAMRDAHSPATMANRDRMQTQAIRDAELQSLFSTTNRAGFGARIFDAIARNRNAQEPITLTQLAGEVLGAQRTDDMATKLMLQLNQLQERQNEFLNPATSQQRRVELMDELRGLFAGLDAFGARNNLPGFDFAGLGPPDGRSAVRLPRGSTPAAAAMDAAGFSMETLNGLIGNPIFAVVGTALRSGVQRGEQATQVAAALGTPAAMTLTGTLQLTGLTEALLRASGAGSTPVMPANTPASSAP